MHLSMHVCVWVRVRVLRVFIELIRQPTTTISALHCVLYLSISLPLAHTHVAFVVLILISFSAAATGEL